MPKMPANNRVSGSVALKTNDIWSKTIGHDPYASSSTESGRAVSGSGNLEGLMQLAKIQNSGNSLRGGCKKCGALGHLTFQCRNEPSIRKEDSSDSSDDSSEDEVIPRAIEAVDTNSGKRKHEDEKFNSSSSSLKKAKKHKKEKKAKKDRKHRKSRR